VLLASELSIFFGGGGGGTVVIMSRRFAGLLVWPNDRSEKAVINKAGKRKKRTCLLENEKRMGVRPAISNDQK